MRLYSDSELPVRPALEVAHGTTLASFAGPGSWYNGAERCEIVREARQARTSAGLQDDGGDEPVYADLSPVARRVARRVAISVDTLTRDFMEEALADGLSVDEYVEVVGVVSRAVNVDLFARGLGLPVRPLPLPTDQAPVRLRPSTACDEGAWVPTVPGGSRGGEEARRIYGSADPQAAPFIYRALSLCPDEAAGLVALGAAQYLEIKDFMDLDFTYEPTLSRPQYELLAARVSALHQCFY
ncbi:MAG: hypothetical protein FJ164_10265 [Gammaproteobacteria bacterium]|nr:hypothetical protein [Gammaproteobacteria bacterium]